MKLSLKLEADVLELIRQVYPLQAASILEALATPTSRYFVRVNTARIGVDELLRKLQERGLEA